MAREPGCVFCDIVAGDAAAHIVIDNDVGVGFLDVRPLFPGHVLWVPRDHYRTLDELPSDLVGAYFRVAQRLVVAVQNALDAPGTFVAMNNVVSQSVPHLHTHVVPRRPRDGLRGFFWPRNGYDDDAHAARVAADIRAALAATAPDAP